MSRWIIWMKDRVLEDIWIENNIVKMTDERIIEGRGQRGRGQSDRWMEDRKRDVRRIKDILVGDRAIKV